MSLLAKRIQLRAAVRIDLPNDYVTSENFFAEKGFAISVDLENRVVQIWSTRFPKERYAPVCICPFENVDAWWPDVAVTQQEPTKPAAPPAAARKRAAA
jgi:hypothetical protein